MSQCVRMCLGKIYPLQIGSVWWGESSHSINNSTVCRTDRYTYIYTGGQTVGTYTYIYKPIEQSAICFLVGYRLVKK